MNLHNPKDRDNVKAVLEQGGDTDFWKLIVQAIEENIERLKKEMDDDMSSLPAEQYKTRRECLIAEIKHFEYLRELPKEIIMSLDSTEFLEPRYDPYSFASDFKNS